MVNQNKMIWSHLMTHKKINRPRLTCATCKFQDHLFDLVGRYRPANDNIKEGEKPHIVIPDDDLLLRPATTARLAIALRAKGLSRRAFPNFILDMLYGFKGDISYADGTPFCRCAVDVDAAFNDDGSFRWLQDFLEFADRDPQQNMQERVLPRLQLIFLALAIDDPTLAAHVLW
jgi:hypothetical protein